MDERTKMLLGLRPKIETIDKELNTGDAEDFQNSILRPILKFQNELLLNLFVDYAHQYKGVFFKLEKLEQLDYINKSIRTNQLFRNMLIGSIIGFFSVTEFQIYKLNSSVYNKRIVSMIIQRLQDQIMVLKNGFSVEVGS